MPHFLSDYFWLLGSLWTGGVGALICYIRLGKHVKNGALSKDERLDFVKGWLIAFGLPGIALWRLQLSAGANLQPLYSLWPEPQKWVALSINIICSALLLWWIWAANGARYLSRIALLIATPLQKTFLSVMVIKIASLITVASSSFWVIKQALAGAP
jgi:hypothetical protein